MCGHILPGSLDILQILAFVEPFHTFGCARKDQAIALLFLFMPRGSKAE
jgi:hypothetical protein